MAVLFKAGLHEPVMPLFEMLGNGDRLAPEQIGPTASKVGTVEEFTVTLRVPFEAHCPASGVKVYTVRPGAAVLMVDGLQVPVLPSKELAGKAGAASPTHKAGIVLKFDVFGGVMLIV